MPCTMDGPTHRAPQRSNLDGRISLEEALAFAHHATGLSRDLKARDTLTAAALTQGHCSLAMWRALQRPGGRAKFVEWVVRLITGGAELGAPAGWGAPCVGLAAVKNLCMLFDMEVREGRRGGVGGVGGCMVLRRWCSADLNRRLTRPSVYPCALLPSRSAAAPGPAV
jgi:hypothetical protein